MSAPVIDKKRLIEEIVTQLSHELESIRAAAKSAHEAATHEESKAEDQHDTRGLEASYLAGAQAARATDIAQQVALYRAMSAREFGAHEGVAPGALFELVLGGRKMHYFLVPQGGGLTLQFEGLRIQVITPQSPMGEAVIGRVAGESVEVEAQGSVREYELVWVK